VEFFSLLRRRRSSGSRKQGYEEEEEGDDEEAFCRSESENSCDDGQQEQEEYEIAASMSSSSKRHREEEEEEEKEEAHGRGGREFEERSKLHLAPHSVLLAVGLEQQQSADDEEEQKEGDEEEQEQEQEEPLLSHKSCVQLDSRITMTTGKQVDRRRKELKNLGQYSEAFLEPSLLACARHRGGSSQISISGDKEEEEEDAFQQLPLQQQVKTVLSKKMIERGARSIFLRSTYHAQEALLRRGNGDL
jgi:hypothetical protein